MNLVANVLSNNFWEVRKDGKKLAFIQETPNGYTLKKTDLRVFSNKSFTENFKSLSEISSKYQIKFETRKKKSLNEVRDDQRSVFGYATNSIAYNKVFDFKNSLPLYTKTTKSKSYYCAGWYAVAYKNKYVAVSNPKIITIKRAKFFGPYKSFQDIPKELID